MTIVITDILAGVPHGASLDIFTDGASKNNPGPAGWGFVVVHEDTAVHSASASIGKTTNVVAEMTGALRALESLRERPDINATIFSDNQMLIRGMTEWLSGWKRKGWRKSDGKPVLNADLWKALDSAASALPAVAWQWVRGHDGNEFNEMADGLASEAARGAV